jgi:hypothetical protein
LIAKVDDVVADPAIETCNGGHGSNLEALIRKLRG